jgi:hypothetical protein
LDIGTQDLKYLIISFWERRGTAIIITVQSVEVVFVYKYKGGDCIDEIQIMTLDLDKTITVRSRSDNKDTNESFPWASPTT